MAELYRNSSCSDEQILNRQHQISNGTYASHGSSSQFPPDEQFNISAMQPMQFYCAVAVMTPIIGDYCIFDDSDYDSIEEMDAAYDDYCIMISEEYEPLTGLYSNKCLIGTDVVEATLALVRERGFSSAIYFQEFINSREDWFTEIYLIPMRTAFDEYEIENFNAPEALLGPCHLIFRSY